MLQNLRKSTLILRWAVVIWWHLESPWWVVTATVRLLWRLRNVPSSVDLDFAEIRMLAKCPKRPLDREHVMALATLMYPLIKYGYLKPSFIVRHKDGTFSRVPSLSQLSASVSAETRAEDVDAVYSRR